ncbi:hypothetical protein [Maribacter sp. IgM3_T14_3]|uniref:hypothetical protein n=1 Tax=Maribacter sp. IgM3_T14_3 TaxID=3415140 RepID=UPI003C70219A
MKNIKKGIIEIRTYHLKENSGKLFHEIINEKSIPMHKRWNICVLAYGNSITNQDSYFLVRHYHNIEEKKISQDSFYGSDEWKLGPRESIISCIENSIDIVIPFNKEIKTILLNLNIK